MPSLTLRWDYYLNVDHEEWSACAAAQAVVSHYWTTYKQNSGYDEGVNVGVISMRRVMITEAFAKMYMPCTEA